MKKYLVFSFLLISTICFSQIKVMNLPHVLKADDTDYCIIEKTDSMPSVRTNKIRMDSLFASMNTGGGLYWDLIGNAGTSSATNIIGTVDSNTFEIELNGNKYAFIDFAGNGNTSWGYQANTLNVVSVPFTGFNNTALGTYALYSNTTGYDNTAIGWQALYSNISAHLNIAIGPQSLQDNISGNNNIAVGVSALFGNTTGSFNLAIGGSALASNNGIRNTAIGLGALGFNTTGNNNVALGFDAAAAPTTATDITALGFYAAAHSSASNIIAIGDSSLLANQGINNTAVGDLSMYLNSTGISNTSLGFQALLNSSTGSFNTAIGDSAGYDLTTGHNNTCIGYQTSCATSFNNSTALGNGAAVTKSNQIVLGNSSVTNIYLKGGLPAYASDAAAGSAGLTTGMLYQTNGAGSGVFAFTGVVMIKQ